MNCERRNTEYSRRIDSYSVSTGRRARLEDDPAKRRRLLAALFDRIWKDGGTIVVVKPREAFPLPPDSRRTGSSPREEARCQNRERRDSNPRFTGAIRIRRKL